MVKAKFDNIEDELEIPDEAEEEELRTTESVVEFFQKGFHS